MNDQWDKLVKEYEELVKLEGLYASALMDIASGDETSTVAGAVAIALHALKRGQELKHGS